MTIEVTPWPADHLESVPHCPICQHDGRELVHEGLTDVTFSTAKGAWNLWRCSKCGSGYLDPRPDEASIGEAYETYYTHEAEAAVAPPYGWRHRLGNGYRNWRFGTRMEPSSSLGIVAAHFVPALCETIDASYRYLPNPRDGQPRRLLDFGCGAGAFLALGRGAQWACFGVEPDPNARAIAASDGIDVRCCLADFKHERFDAVTLSHVIEHVHDPVGLLRALANRMEHGAHLYIDTPNMDAVGHRLYARNWRGLETPRHLCLLTRPAMDEALRAAGFTNVTYRDCPGALEFTQAQSRRIAAGGDPYEVAVVPAGTIPDSSAYLEATRGPKAEFLRLTATLV